MQFSLLVDLHHAMVSCWNADASVVQRCKQSHSGRCVSCHLQSTTNSGQRCSAAAPMPHGLGADVDELAHAQVCWVSTPAAGADYLPTAALRQAGYQVT